MLLPTAHNAHKSPKNEETALEIGMFLLWWHGRGAIHVHVILWSCWADSNCRPHPYQISKGCCFLSLFIFSYCLLFIAPQGFEVFSCFSCRCLPSPVISGFLMMVSVLCRFLCQCGTADLIFFRRGTDVVCQAYEPVSELSHMNTKKQETRRGQFSTLWA